jgi:hypothetical protein
MYSLVTELESERKKYGDTMTGDQCVALLNDVLWNDQRKGYRLVEKTSGNNGRRSDGRECSVDGIVWVGADSNHRTFIDVLKSAGGVSKPTWQVHAIGATSPSGNIHKPHSGPLLEAIAPVGTQPEAPTPTPEPEPVPQPDSPKPPNGDTATMAGLLALTREVETLVDAYKALEQAQRVLLAKVVALEQASYSVKGATSRSFYGTHSHDIDLKVERMK